MNIFVTDICPIKSAIFLDSKRVIKMVLESAQMLSTTMWYYGKIGPYKITHINHPCSIWARETRMNYLWLYAHFMALCTEYTKRYEKTHKCENYSKVFYEFADKIPNGKLTSFVNCTTYKNEPNVYKAYTKYLQDKWKTDKRSPVWT